VENYEEKILKTIDEDVSSNAELVRKQVEQETEALRQDQLSFYEEGLKKETDTYLEKELSELRFYAATKSSKDKMDTKKKLLQLRQSLTAKLFDEVSSDLHKFTSSGDYEKWLQKHLDEIKISDTGVFAAREQDKPLLTKLLSAKGLHNKVETAYLEIGGFLYRDEAAGVEYSCTLDDNLKAAREWFRNHSGFRVEESEDAA
jgi:vacuolar-type H+-ATPase subunit E/Vma4